MREGGGWFGADANVLQSGHSASNLNDLNLTSTNLNLNLKINLNY